MFSRYCYLAIVQHQNRHVSCRSSGTWGNCQSSPARWFPDTLVVWDGNLMFKSMEAFTQKIHPIHGALPSSLQAIPAARTGKKLIIKLPKVPTLDFKWQTAKIGWTKTQTWTWGLWFPKWKRHSKGWCGQHCSRMIPKASQDSSNLHLVNCVFPFRLGGSNASRFVVCNEADRRKSSSHWNWRQGTNANVSGWLGSIRVGQLSVAAICPVVRLVICFCGVDLGAFKSRT